MNSKCSYLRGERAFCKTSWTLSFKRSTQCQAAIKTTVEQFRARDKYNFDMKARYLFAPEVTLDQVLKDKRNLDIISDDGVSVGER